MLALYNNALCDLNDAPFSRLNRAFRYGDGLFETIAVLNGEPRFLSRHLERLRAGARVLGLENADISDEALIASNCMKMHENSSKPPFGILRMYLFRDGDGQYSPLSRSAHLLMTLESKPPPIVATAQKAGFSERVVNFPTITSRFKTISALKYVLAGMEKTERSLDEIIISDYHGYISETLAANIFWKKGNIYYTPPIDTGCIDGIMRNWLIEKLRSGRFTVSEVQINAAELLTADALFAVNALGLKHILSIEKHHFSIDTIAGELIQSIS
ncbi:MAG: aminotransferase class IV [Cyclobacteriaceae bacterium]|nr:aminotransferase class IV [Cyclobacteriaceae bacterium]